MVFVWVFSLLAVLFLLIYGFIFPSNKYTDVCLMIFGIISVFPLFLPIMDFIKKDEKKSEKFFTRAGIVGVIGIAVILLICFFVFKASFSTLVFLFFLLFGVYFGIESRWYFFAGLSALIFVILSLILEHKNLAEMLSIFVYLSLVAGVSVEILSPIFTKIHKNSREVFYFSEEFVNDYKKEIGNYVLISVFIGFFVILASIFSEKYHYGIILEQKILIGLSFYMYGAIIFYYFLSGKVSIVKYFLEKVKKIFFPKEKVSFQEFLRKSSEFFLFCGKFFSSYTLMILVIVLLFLLFYR